MTASFQEEFHEFLMRNTEYAGQHREQTEEYRKKIENQKHLQKELLKFVPECDHMEAHTILEDLDASYNREVDFYYLCGIQHCTRILRLLGIF